MSMSYAPGSTGRSAAEAIVRCFETSTPTGGYDRVADSPTDPGGLSYGWFQAADSSDALDRVVRLYVERGGRFAAALSPWIPVLASDAGRGHRDLKGLLRQAAADPMMRAAQDDVFRTGYGDPAAREAEGLGLVTALGYAVALDSRVQSGRVRRDIRNRFPELPPSRGGDEAAWLAAYLHSRRAWLQERKGDAAKSVYRVDALLALLAQGSFDLTPPFDVRLGGGSVTVEARHLEALVEAA